MELKDSDIELLIKSAFEAQKNSYAPYSKFNVGASVLCDDGKIYTGCNVENASYPAGICAERVAYCNAISNGKKHFVACCITSCDENYTYPCGLCRQFMSEFDKNTKIIVAKNLNDYKIFDLCELLPHGFKL